MALDPGSGLPSRFPVLDGPYWRVGVQNTPLSAIILFACHFQLYLHPLRGNRHKADADARGQPYTHNILEYSAPIFLLCFLGRILRPLRAARAPISKSIS